MPVDFTWKSGKVVVETIVICSHMQDILKVNNKQF